MFKKYMPFKAESNSELTVIVPAYQLHFRCKKKYTNKKFCRTPGLAYLAVLPVLVIFCPLGPTNFKKSVHSANIPIALQKKPTNILPTDSIIYIQNPYYSERYASYTPQLQTTCNTQSSVQNLTSSVVRQRLQSTIWQNVGNIPQLLYFLSKHC